MRWKHWNSFVKALGCLVVPAPSNQGSRKRKVALCLEVLEDRTVLQAPAWTLQGPAPERDTANVLAVGGHNVSGRVSSLAVATNYDGLGGKALLLGAASGGVWRTTISATATDFPDEPSWQQKSDNLAGTRIPGVNNIGALAVDTNHPANQRDIIYAGTGEANYSGDSGAGAGILKSTDGGDSWSLLRPMVVIAGNNREPFFGRSVAKIIVQPNVAGAPDPAGTLYVALVPNGKDAPTDATGIYKSTNRGDSWTKLTVAPGNAPIIPTDLEYTIVRNGGNQKFVLWAGLGNPKAFAAVDNANNGIWKSEDGGRNWTPLRAGGAPTGEGIVGNGNFAVRGEHTFRQAGSYMVRTSISGADETTEAMFAGGSFRVTSRQRSAEARVLSPCFQMAL